MLTQIINGKIFTPQGWLDEVQRFEELSKVKDVEVNGKVEMIHTFSRLGKKTIELHEISKSFGQKKLFDEFSYMFKPVSYTHLDVYKRQDFYYWYTQDQLIEVSDEVAEVFKADARYEMAYQRRLSRHKAQYSLDCDDGIEYSACLHEPTPQQGLFRLSFWRRLHSPPNQQ